MQNEDERPLPFLEWTMTETFMNGARPGTRLLRALNANLERETPGECCVSTQVQVEYTCDSEAAHVSMRDGHSGEVFNYIGERLKAMFGDPRPGEHELERAGEQLTRELNGLYSELAGGFQFTEVTVEEWTVTPPEPPPAPKPRVLH